MGCRFTSLMWTGNAAQHWMASLARVNHELGYEEPVTIHEAIRQTIPWERETPQAVAFLAQLDYAAVQATPDELITEKFAKEQTG